MLIGKAGQCLLNFHRSPSLIPQRFKRINVQRPKAPFYERARVLALLKPQYKQDPLELLPPSLKCRKQEEQERKLWRPDNPYEKILAREMYEDFENSKLIGFLHKNIIKGEEEFQVKVKLKREDMKIKVYSRYTAKLAFENTRYEAVLQLLVAHNAVVLCEQAKVQVLMKLFKKIPQYILLAAIVEGRLLSITQMETYAQLKDLNTARAQFVDVLNTTSRNITTQLNQHQSTLITRLQQIVEVPKTVDPELNTS